MLPVPEIAGGMFLFNIFNTDALECRAGKASARPTALSVLETFEPIQLDGLLT